MKIEAIITSDLHLGSPFLQHGHLEHFLDLLPPRAMLILNGDVVDRVNHALPPPDRALLDRLVEESERRPVVWVYGNHDDGFHPAEAGSIRFVRDFALGARLHINHGYDFDNVMPRNILFMNLFRALHRMRLRLGAEPVHVARFAKKFPLLYRYLRRNVMLNAVEHAREQGCAAVTCGHTHFVEDVLCDGVRYINTGSWTELPIHVLVVTAQAISLRAVRIGEPLGGSGGDS